MPAGDAADPALLAFEVALCVIAVFLVRRLRTLTTATVADLVVELDEMRSGTLRDGLAVALGDPTLQVGHLDAASGMFLDHEGRPVELPAPDSARSATFLERDARGPAIVLVHDRAVLTDPALVDAISAAARLAASNVALNAEVRDQLSELAASSRRLLAAAGAEQRRLEERLRAGPQRRLAGLAESLVLAVGGSRGPPQERLERLLAELLVVLEELGELAHGLHPRVLNGPGPRRCRRDARRSQRRAG